MFSEIPCAQNSVKMDYVNLLSCDDFSVTYMGSIDEIMYCFAVFSREYRRVKCPGHGVLLQQISADSV